MLRGMMAGILTIAMGIFLTGCGEEDVTKIDSAEFYAVPESNGPSELPTVVGPTAPPPRE